MSSELWRIRFWRITPQNYFLSITYTLCVRVLVVAAAGGGNIEINQLGPHLH